MLAIKWLNLSLGGRPIFKDCELNVAAAEHVVIVGDSGGGKSTLLNMIADGHPSVQIKQGASSTMVLQEGALLDHLNVLENLKLVQRYNSMNGSPETTLQQLNIDEHLHTSDVSQLSGGQMRRVAIARALITAPDILLFDEPDAGLDIANLSSLAETVKQLTVEQQKTCITVSHNPFYIAQIANKVYRLQSGRLKLIADWPELPDSDEERQARQLQLQAALGEVIDAPVDRAAIRPQPQWVFPLWYKGVFKALASLVHVPKSVSDELRIAGYSYYLSFITGILFFALVGFMLGATTIAVVRTLADSALSGVVSWFIDPEDLIEMMGGRFALYLAPAIGGMLYVARSGSIVSNWLGELQRGRQARALDLLNIPTSQYLSAPNVWSLFLGMICAISLFCSAIWLGGLVATEQLFNVPNSTQAMVVSSYDVAKSLFWQKTLTYSALVALTVTALGMATKRTAHQVNIHTTKAIIYGTLSIAAAELLIILI